MNEKIQPRPNAFQIDVPMWGWVTFRERETDIPSILDKIWELAHTQDMSIRVVTDTTSEGS